MRPMIPCIAFALTASVALAQAPTPEQHLGRPCGADFTLADWQEVSSYYAKLAAASPRVKVMRLGATTEGRDFLLVAISSEENLSRLAEIQSAAARVADPRGSTPEEKEKALASGKAILFISNAMHSTECAAPQFAMKLAYELATFDTEPYKTARENVVTLILPCTNPDGLDAVTAWYRKTVHTPYEGAGLPELYHRYAGHDNNRDWFMLSLTETRLVSEQLYSVWHPQVYWDVHQQGSRNERMFIPPYRDPLDPNLDAGVIAGIDALSSRALLDMTRSGLSGIATGITFDMWWNGGNRNVPVRHNMIGLLTEAASANLASPIFVAPSELRPPGDLAQYAPSNLFVKPWPGGWWRIGDVIEYEMAYARSLLGSMGREPRLWLATTMEAAQRVVDSGKTDAPIAWIIPSDNRDRGAVSRLVDVLLAGGVEIDVAGDRFDAGGTTWPRGSLVIRRAQPYGNHVKDLFEVQRYPGDKPPYDIAGWTLPLLLGVERAEIDRPFEARLERAKSTSQAVAAFTGVEGDQLDLQDSRAWVTVFDELKAGKGFDAAFDSDGRAGFLARNDDPESAEIGAAPRVAVYDSFSGSMEEGWLRWVLDHYGVAYTRVFPDQVRAGRLRASFDALILPGISKRELDQGRADGTVFPEYAGGLAPEGSVAIERFVKEGGNLIAIDSSCRFAIDLFGLDLKEATRSDKAKDFSCPGSVLRVQPTSLEAHAIAGLPSSIAMFFAGATAFEEPDPKAKLEVLLRYAPAESLLLSGWIKQPEAIAGKPAWVRAEIGDGFVNLFAFAPHYRSWTQQCFPLLFRALLFGGK